MNIDKKIKEALQQDSDNIDKMVAKEPGIFQMLFDAYKGSLGRWILIVGVVTFAVTVLMFWCGYQFFFVEGNMMHKLHWGVGLLLSTMVQIAMKMWSFMEMNRQSVIRELKRIELAIERLEKE